MVRVWQALTGQSDGLGPRLSQLAGINMINITKLYCGLSQSADALRLA